MVSHTPPLSSRPEAWVLTSGISASPLDEDENGDDGDDDDDEEEDITDEAVRNEQVFE